VITGRRGYNSGAEAGATWILDVQADIARRPGRWSIILLISASLQTSKATSWRLSMRTQTQSARSSFPTNFLNLAVATLRALRRGMVDAGTTGARDETNASVLGRAAGGDKSRTITMMRSTCHHMLILLLARAWHRSSTHPHQKSSRWGDRGSCAVSTQRSTGDHLHQRLMQMRFHLQFSTRNSRHASHC
jgi:hypothetical protein